MGRLSLKAVIPSERKDPLHITRQWHSTVRENGTLHPLKATHTSDPLTMNITWKTLLVVNILFQSTLSLHGTLLNSGSGGKKFLNT